MLLERLGHEYTEFLVDKDPSKREEMLEKSGGKRTVPQIFIGETSIGGFDDLAALHQKGELDAMLKD